MVKSVTFYFDKESCGLVTLHKSDRTLGNQLSEGLGESIGSFVTMLTNEITRMRDGETLSVRVTKE